MNIFIISIIIIIIKNKQNKYIYIKQQINNKSIIILQIFIIINIIFLNHINNNTNIEVFVTQRAKSRGGKKQDKQKQMNVMRK